MSQRAIYRYEVPVDDQWHEIMMSGKITGTGSRRPGVVEFWALASTDPDYASPRSFRVYGTGHALPDDVRPDQLHGSVIAGGGLVVWHLVERKI